MIARWRVGASQKIEKKACGDAVLVAETHSRSEANRGLLWHDRCCHDAVRAQGAVRDSLSNPLRSRLGQQNQ